MGTAGTSKRNAFRYGQNALLYDSAGFTTVGALLAVVIILVTVSPYIELRSGLVWATIMLLCYANRVYDWLQFRSTDDAVLIRDAYLWGRRLYYSATICAVAWSSSALLIFPVSSDAHQVLLMLALSGIAAGGLASLSYDKKISMHFQIVLIVPMVARLCLQGTVFSMQLAAFGVVMILFCAACTRRVANNYREQVTHRMDTQETSNVRMDITEKMAKMGYWQWNKGDSMMTISENLANMIGTTKRTITKEVSLKVLHDEDREKVARSFTRIAQFGGEVSFDYRMKNVNGDGYRDMRQVIRSVTDTNDQTFLLGTVQDITAIKSAEQKIYQMAYTDGLTGLANRESFQEYLNACIERSQTAKLQFAVVYIDLDNFKGINDSYGHACGDAYLKRFADHLRSIASPRDFVARIGGDEFCIVIDQASDLITATDCCLSFNQNVIRIASHRIHPKLSIGIARFPEHGTTADSLIRSADMAMYHVKNHGKDSFAIYDEKMSSKLHEQVKLEAALRQSVNNNELELWYQPKLRTRDQKICGVEALIRWHHPERGLVQPDVFISLAERVGVIGDIGHFVITTACEQLSKWQAQGYQLQMAVNVSSDHFAAPGFSDFVIETVAEHNIQPEMLEIEITESLSRDPSAHTRICRELRDAGIRVAIDDFGTGYSSLSVLGNLEVDTLKIDKTFVNGLPNDQASCLLVKAIMEMSLGLGYEVVAEGVETKEHLAFLEALGCPYFQGYLFSPPLTAKDIDVLFAKSLMLNSDKAQQKAA